jgi:hypothetical protein
MMGVIESINLMEWGPVDYPANPYCVVISIDGKFNETLYG